MFNRSTIWVEFGAKPIVWFGGWGYHLMERFGDPSQEMMAKDYYPGFKFEILSRQMDSW